MPLTPSHAAAAWPLARLAPRLPLAGLVVGTLAPDFEYLVRLAPRGRTWHTPLGLLTLAVPAGALVWMVWRAVVRPAVQRLLPPRLQPTLAPLPWTIGSVAAGVVAVLLGAASHVAWDGLTHPGGWAVSRWDVLVAPVGIGPVTMPAYKVLQHGSTVLGAVVLVIWGLGWWRQQPREARAFAPGQPREAMIALCGLLTAAALGASLNALRAPASLGLRLGYAAVGAMLALGLAAVLWGGARLIRTHDYRESAN
jgi:hypothetical protein